MITPLLEVNDVSFQYHEQRALSGISFRQQAGERLAIAGQTGSGKTSLLKIAAGLLQPAQGYVQFMGKPVKGPDDVLVAGHSEIAYLSQNFELPKFIRVEQAFNYVNREQESYAAKIIKWCRVDHVLNRKTDELSGGERQRVAVARLLLSHPRLLILDEPFSNLDIVQKSTLKETLAEVEKRTGLSFILVSHDPQDSLSWADKILALKDGRVLQTGTPEEVYRSPRNDYVASLFGTFAHIDKTLARKWKAKEGTLIRPEQLAISKSSLVNSVAGRVVAIRYYGLYFEADIETNTSTFTVRHLNRLIKERDTVYVSLRKK